MKTTLLPKISYTTSKDEILLEFRPVNSEPEIKRERFRLWWDRKGNICALAVISLKEEIKEFKKSLSIPQPLVVNKEGVLVVQAGAVGEIVGAEREERMSKSKRLRTIQRLPVSPPEVADSAERASILRAVVKRMQQNPIPVAAPRLLREELHERR